LVKPGELLTLAGYLVGAAVFLLEARRRRWRMERMGWVVCWALVGGVLGARLAEWGLHGEALRRNPLLLLDPAAGGRTVLGGLAGGYIAVVAARRRLGIRHRTGDAFALALPAGEAIGRLGCFLNGCCYGRESAVPWAVWQHGAFRHPAQLYSAAFCLALFALVWSLRRRPWPEGRLFSLYLALYTAGRFFLEFWRQPPSAAGVLTLAQWSCLVALGWVLAAWVRSHWNERGEEAQRPLPVE
jgi:phosphatidylglycerol---prolipoprotein diacylglyceryl transferase